MSTVRKWERETKRRRRRRNPEYFGPGYTSYIEDYEKKSDAELIYIMRDASKAAKRAQELGDDRAEAKYLDQINDAATVMHRRRHKRKNPNVYIDIDPIVEGMARAFYATSWAQGVEDRGGSLSGVEIMDVLPEPIPEAAWRAARELAALMAGEKGLKRVLQKAAVADGDEDLIYDPDYAEELGHYLAMMAMGSGVSWFDDHGEFPIIVEAVEMVSPDDLPEEVFDDY